MTPEERQALRRKHRRCPCGLCEGAQCVDGCMSDYPCDVIKVLDATDTQRQAIIDVLALGHIFADELRDAILKTLK